MNPLADYGYATVEYDEILRGAMPDTARLDKFEAWLLKQKAINWREVYPGVVLSLVYELYRAEYANHVLVESMARIAWQQPYAQAGASDLLHELRWNIERLDGPGKDG